MGEWRTPEPRVLLADVLGSEAFGIPADRRDALASALLETGFLVAAAYYVPDVDELFATYRQLAEVDYHGRGRVPRTWLRWVMCGETQEALQRKCGKTNAVHTPNLAAFIAGDDSAMGSIADELHLVMTTRAAASVPAAVEAGRLFDMPIRRDPAARRPMFELIPEGER